MPEKKRTIIPLADFISLVPAVNVSVTPDRKESQLTSSVCNRILNLKIDKDAIEAEDKPLRAPILAALRDLGFDGVEVPYSSEYSYIIAITEKENRTIDRTLLLEAGIDPDLINRCTKVTPSVYLEARAKKVHP